MYMQHCKKCFDTLISKNPPTLFFAVKCSNLTNPANGQVTVNGSTAFYICNTGFELDPAMSRSCQNDGEWSGKAPTCKRMLCCHSQPDTMIDVIGYS